MHVLKTNFYGRNQNILEIVLDNFNTLISVKTSFLFFFLLYQFVNTNHSLSTRFICFYSVYKPGGAFYV